MWDSYLKKLFYPTCPSFIVVRDGIQFQPQPLYQGSVATASNFAGVKGVFSVCNAQVQSFGNFEKLIGGSLSNIIRFSFSIENPISNNDFILDSLNTILAC